MQLVLHHLGKKKPGKVTVSDAVFAQKFNEPLVHQVLVAYMSGSRAGTKAQKTRAEVRGGGRKPWRQKGLGRARVGSIRVPLWRGGGATFAAQPRDYTSKVNRKMYRGAIRSILSELARQERLTCIDKFELTEPRTKAAREALNNLGFSEVLIVTDQVADNVYLATRNVKGVEVINTDELNPYSLVGYERVLMTKDAVDKVEAWLS